MSVNLTRYFCTIRSISLFTIIFKIIYLLKIIICCYNSLAFVEA